MTAFSVGQFEVFVPCFGKVQKPTSSRQDSEPINQILNGQQR
jgi:hypothetical protein